MSEEWVTRILLLPADWQEQWPIIEAAGLDPVPILAAQAAHRVGLLTERCAYKPDPEIWRYYQQMGKTDA